MSYFFLNGVGAQSLTLPADGVGTWLYINSAGIQDRYPLALGLDGTPYGLGNVLWRVHSLPAPSGLVMPPGLGGWAANAISGQHLDITDSASRLVCQWLPQGVAYLIPSGGFTPPFIINPVGISTQWYLRFS